MLETEKITQQFFGLIQCKLQQKNKGQKIFIIMEIQKLLENQNITISLTGEQLNEFANQILSGARAIYEKTEEPEQYITRKRAAEMLGVTNVTIWRWKKESYLVPIEVGGKYKYRLSDINRILGKGTTL